MSSLTYSTFAVAGQGDLGTPIAEELVGYGAKVVLLTRGDGSSAPSGVQPRKVDYDNEQSLVDALNGVDVVVSVVGKTGLAVQPKLVDAAKKAGVQLFVPSEFGCRTHDVPKGGLFAVKQVVIERLEAVGLPYTLYNCGLFSDLKLNPILGFDLDKKTATIVGSGKTKFTLTTRPDVAHFVAYTLTHLPKSQLEGGIFGVAGSRLSLLEIVGILETAFGGKFTVEHRDVSDVEKLVAEKGYAVFVDYLLLQIEAGYGDGAINNDLVPGWKPLTFEEAVKKYY